MEKERKTLNFKVSARFSGVPKIVLSEDLSEFLCMQKGTQSYDRMEN